MDAASAVMLGRRLRPTLHKYGPYTLAFLLGYAIKSLDNPSGDHISHNREQLPSLEKELPSSSLIVLVMTAPANSEVRDVIRNTWLSVSQKEHSFKALFVVGKTDLNSTEMREFSSDQHRERTSFYCLHFLSSDSVEKRKWEKN